jgi:fatty acid-binding protein DegV
MQLNSAPGEGYDALDVATTVAVDYVRKFQSGELKRSVATDPSTSHPNVARTLLMVDTACELPQAWLDYNAVGVVPRAIKLSAGYTLEKRDRDSTLRFLAEIEEGRHGNTHSVPLSALQIRDEMQKHMTPRTEAALLLCSSASRSKFFMNTIAATQSLVLIHTKARRSMADKTPFTAWAIDSLNALGGVGVQLAHAVMLRNNGLLASEIAVSLNAFRHNVHTIVAPHDMTFVAHTAQHIERASIPRWKLNLTGLLHIRPLLHLNNDTAKTMRLAWGSANAIDRVFRVTEAQIKRGLATPFICMSYAGRLEDIEATAEYAALRALCHRSAITLSLAMMSITGITMLGPRALSVSFASEHFSG